MSNYRKHVFPKEFLFLTRVFKKDDLRIREWMGVAGMTRDTVEATRMI